MARAQQIIGIWIALVRRQGESATNKDFGEPVGGAGEIRGKL